MKPFTIYVRKLEVTNKDGKKFNAFETCDTKDKKRLTVAFLLDGKEPLKESARITVTAGRMDLSKRFPVLRIADYEIVPDEIKENDKTSDFFD